MKTDETVICRARSTRARPLLLLALAALSSCTYASIDAGYLDLEMNGDLGFQENTTNAAIGINVDQLGQGSDVGSPYGRIEIGSDSGVFGAGMMLSGFVFDNQGSGILTADFGQIRQNAQVDTDFNFINAKAAFYLSFDIANTVYIRPGIAADLIFPDMSVREVSTGLTETLDDPGGVPLPYLQIGVDTGVVAGFVEAGYLPLDTDDISLGDDYDVESTTIDVEAMIKVRPIKPLELFIGYRYFSVDLDGTVEGDAVLLDLEIRGLMFGGGVTW
jgi:hypothetical protein